MRIRQLLPALAGALTLVLPATVALAASGPLAPAPATAADDAADLAAVRAADRATHRVQTRLEHRDAVTDVVRLARTRARLADERAARRVTFTRWSTRDLRRHERRLRARVSELRRTGGAPDVPIPAALAAIAQCESGGDPGAVSANGSYRGLFQFDYGTWASVGGSGDPAAASSEEQYRRAAMLYARSGAAPWPVCGR